MKALFVSPAAAVYGSERSMLALMQSNQFDAEVVCPTAGELERELCRLDIKVYPQEFGKYSVRENPFWHLGFFLRFRRILQASKPDVVVINLEGNTPVVTLSAVMARIPIIRFSRFEFQPPTRFVDRWCWRKATAVICPSDWVKQQVLNWGGESFNARTHRLYDAYVAPERRASPDSAFPNEFRSDGEVIIGCIGRIHRAKRFETAIESLALVRESGKNARLLIIGDGDGSPQAKAHREELSHLADKLEVSHAVTFAGYVSHDQVSRIFSLIDVFMLPSESESFGMVLMEAWAHGVPTVASDIGGCGEITRASGGGLLAPVADAGLFATHILNLLADPEMAEGMASSGRDWVLRNCDPKAYALRFGELLNEITYRG